MSESTEPAPRVLSALSSDRDRSLYLALRAIFLTAQQCSVEFKRLGWCLHGTFTDPERDIVTEYENEAMRMRIKMTSYPDDTDWIVMTAIDERDNS